MTKEIIEGNKLIAEFMGWKHNNPDHYSVPNEIEFDFKNVSHGRIRKHVSNLRFNDNWRWLMPVVEKIGSVPICFNVSISSFTGCAICDDQFIRTGEGKVIKGGINGTLIESTWLAVTQFIQFYNTTRPAVQKD